MNFRTTLVLSSSQLAELISDVASGNRIAFEALYSHTSAKLYGIIFRILPRNDLAADILQEAYLRIWQNAGTFDSTKGTPLAWMATIARNRAIDETRRVKQMSLKDMGDNFDPAAEEYDPLDSLDRSDKFKSIMLFLSTLDPKRRELIIMAYYRGVSRETLSKSFGLPVGTVKTHLRHTLAQLKACIAT